MGWGQGCRLSLPLISWARVNHWYSAIRGSWSKFMLMAGAVDAAVPIMVAVLAVSSVMNVYYLLEPVRGYSSSVNAEIKVSNHR